MYCSTEHDSHGVPVPSRVVGLELYLDYRCGDGRYLEDLKHAVEVFRSQLAAFPHLRAAVVSAYPLSILHDIAQASPELSQQPAGEAHRELYYQWGGQVGSCRMSPTFAHLSFAHCRLIPHKILRLSHAGTEGEGWEEP